MSKVLETLNSTPVVPLVQVVDPGVAIVTPEALVKGSLSGGEVAFRPERALQFLSAAENAQPKFVIGVAKQAPVPTLTGIAPPIEVQRAVNPGLEVINVFPASTARGISALKVLPRVFRRMQFMPTVGVAVARLTALPEFPSVPAGGGSHRRLPLPRAV